jgi:hypothetical protein
MLMNDTIKILSRYLDWHKEIAICGDNLYDKHYRPVSLFRRDPFAAFWRIKWAVFSFMEKMVRLTIRESRWMQGYVTGAEMMIRKSIFDMANGPDKEFSCIMKK